MTSSTRHPSSRRLARWVLTGRPAGVGDHVAGCDRCTVLLDSEHSATDRLKARLHVATDPPDGFDHRLTEAVTEAVKRRQAIAALADLFAVGWATPRTIIERHDEGEA